MRQFSLEQWCFQSRKQESRPSKISPQLTGRIQKLQMVSAKIAMWDVFYPATERTIQIQRTTGNDWCDCHVNVYIYIYTHIYILYAVYKLVTPSPHEIHVATEVKKKNRPTVTPQSFCFPWAEIEVPKKAVSIFWGQLWILLGGTVRVFSMTIQVVCVFCRS